MNSDEFTETGRVIVSGGLGITEGFHSWIGSDDLIFKSTATLECWSIIGATSSLLTHSGNDGEVLDDTLSVDSFTGTRFT